MIGYTLYKDTGEIKQFGYCQKQDFDNIVGNKLSVCAESLDYYVESGNLVKKPNKPSEYHVFDYETKTWVDARTAESEWEVVRQKRASLLLASDWTQLPDVPLATKEVWATYRQALRDVTLQSDPFNITWPTAPQ